MACMRNQSGFEEVGLQTVYCLQEPALARSPTTPMSEAAAHSTGRLQRLASTFSRKLGIDRAVWWTLLTQGFRFITGPITMLLMVHFLTPEIQGYAYTFGSIMALSIFLEMGFSTYENMMLQS